MKTKSPWARWSAYFLVAFTAAVLLALCGCERDDSDSPNERSGMVPTTDALTGCQYLIVAGGRGITPRMDRNGKQVCK